MPTQPDTHEHEDHSALQVGQQVDRYVVEAQIGRGATAQVYKVRHRNLDTLYALKVLSLVSPTIRRRTLREGRMQAALRHPHVVGVFDVLNVDGNPGLLMEYIEGPTLEEAMGKLQFTLRQVEVLFRGIVQGVQACHELGLVHRDLKPANVMLANASDGVVPKVTDFGIAKVTEESGHTRTGVAMGTPQYMAPEQIRDARSVDARADIFSLGCILYELLTRVRTFPSDDILQVYHDIHKGLYRPASELRSDIPPRMLQAIDGCLAVDVEQRIPDCATLLQVFDGNRSFQVATGEGTAPVILPEQVGVPLAPGATILPMDVLLQLGEADDLTAGDLLTDMTSPPSLQDHALDMVRAPQDAPVRRRSVLPLVLGLLLLTVGATIALTGGDQTPPEAADQAASVEPAVTPQARTAVVPPAPDAVPEPPPGEPAPVDEAPEPASRPSPGPVKPRVSEPAAPATAPLPSKPATTPAKGPSTVRLVSVPHAAALWIDGSRVGRAPHKVELTEGRHTIRMQSGSLVQESTVRVQPGTEHKWCFVLTDGSVHAGGCP